MLGLRLWLVRHLMPDVAAGVCYGQTDLPLKMPLAAQTDVVQTLRNQLPTGLPVFSSPLQRCAVLARALSAACVTDARLQELNFGAWEMQTWDAIGLDALDAWAHDPAGFCPPGGETGYTVQARALDWLRSVSNQHAEMIVVTHAGVIRALEAHQLRLSGKDWMSLRYDYGQLVRLDVSCEEMHAAPVQ